MMYSKVAKLAKDLNRTLVAFDLEHTGGRCRRITEFGTVAVTPEGDVSSFSSFVQPGSDAEFMPFVIRLTGITPKTVADAPTWDSIFKSHVLQLKDAIWFGFNSNTCDMPIMRNESQRFGEDASALHHVDLMRFGNLGGSLTTRLEKLWPDVSTKGAHRAQQDAEFTMLLLEGLLPTVDFADLIQAKRICITQNVQSAPGNNRQAVPSASKPDMSFLCKNGEQRPGMPWLESERQWVMSMYRKGKEVPYIAQLNGRTPYAVACRLLQEGLIDEAIAATYKKA